MSVNHIGVSLTSFLKDRVHCNLTTASSKTLQTKHTSGEVVD